MKRRNRKLSVEQRAAIYLLYQDMNWTMAELASQFGVSVPRISQIVKEFNDGEYDEK
tara:strand:+ start:6939 stop:7109 length:171 start_codon:yes stop_codon:yes gene_type:complete